MAGPWEKYKSQQGGPNVTMLGNPDPTKQATDAVNLRIKQLEEEAKRRELNDASLNRANTDATLSTKQSDIKFRPLEQARKLADDYRQEQAVKDYASAIGNYGSLLNTKPTPQGDLSLIYSFAKIMDPGSVVREGEMDMANSTSPVVQQIYAKYGKELAGGGALSDATRRQLRLEASNKMGALNDAYLATRVDYKKMADRYGLNPMDVVGEHKGLRYQEAESKLLGRPVRQLDYLGNPKPEAPNGTGDIDRSKIVGSQYESRNSGIAPRGTTTQGGNIPPAMQAEYSWYLSNNPRGKLDPTDFVNFRIEQNKRYGFGTSPEDVNSYASFAKAYNEELNRPVDMRIPAPSQEMTQWEQGRNNFTQSIPGTYLARTTNAFLGGVPEMLSDGDQYSYLAKVNPKTAFLGDITGAVGGVYAGAKGLNAMGLPMSKGLSVANLVQGGSFGASQNPNDPAAGLMTGLIASGAGDVGGRAAGMGLQWAGNTRLGNAAINNVRSTLLPPVNAVRGLFGRRPLSTAPIPRIPEGPSGPEKMIIDNAGDPSQIVPKLQEANRLGLPMVLGDITPGLQMLTGSAVRKSPVVRQLAEDTLRPRALGQNDRLQAAISRDFGDPVSILDRSDALMSQAKTAAGPLYDQAFSAPGASSVGVDDILNTPLGQEALQRARTQAMNDKMDPTALGFDLNDQGEVVLTRVPSFKTLDYVKRSFDDIANEGKTPFGTFQPNQSQATAANLAGELRGRVDAINPVYAQARQAYAGPAGEREALTMGTKAVNQSADQVRYTLGNLGGTKPDQYRLGALSAISDRANNINYSRNPYDAIAGSPEARARLGVLWPQTAPRFTLQADLEAEMGRTFTEALGGSPTQARAVSDQAFDASPAMALGMDAAAATFAGQPPVATLSRLGSNFLKDSWKLGIGRKKAEAVGPLLLSPEAQVVAAQMQDALMRQRISDMLTPIAQRKARTVGGLIGATVAPTVLSNRQ